MLGSGHAGSEAAWWAKGPSLVLMEISPTHLSPNFIPCTPTIELLEIKGGQGKVPDFRCLMYWGSQTIAVIHVRWAKSGLAPGRPIDRIIKSITEKAGVEKEQLRNPQGNSSFLNLDFLI